MLEQHKKLIDEMIDSGDVILQIAARIKITATTIISSTSVYPLPVALFEVRVTPNISVYMV
jgi:hypothetical protein